MNQPAHGYGTVVPTDLSEAEMRALAYFAVGVGSEGSDAGRDISNRLAFAGTISNGIMEPVGLSGFSLGTLQTDLGQHPQVAGLLVDAFQDWAGTQHPDWRLSDVEYRQTVHDLARDGDAIRHDGRRPMNADIKARIDEFLATGDGIRFVHGRDQLLVDGLMNGIVSDVRETALYESSTLDEKAELATMLVKLQNQSGSRWTPRVIRGMEDGTYRSVEDVSDGVGRLRPAVSGRRDYLESGRDHALAGTRTFNALRNSDPSNPMREAWLSVLADPLVDPTTVDSNPRDPDLRAEYTTIKNLFLHPTQAPAFIATLDQGGAFAWGRPQVEGRGQPTAGLYASGNDFVVWNAAGHGYARLGGAWSVVERDDLSRVRHRDGRTELSLRDGEAQRLLLQADPAAPLLRPATAPERQHADAIPHDPTRTESEHPLLRQARAGVERLDAQLGRTYDASSERLVSSLACLACEHGLQRIDHVVLSEQTERVQRGENVFVVQGRIDDPANRMAHMKTDAAMQAPVDETRRRLDAIDAASPVPGLAMESVAPESQRLSRSI